MKNPILTFCLIAFLFTWSVAIYVWRLQAETAPGDLPLDLYHALGAFGPTVGALLAAYLHYGSTGVKRLLKQVELKKWGGPSLSLVVISPVLLFLLGLLVYRILRGQWFDFGQFAAVEWPSAGSVWIWPAPLVAYAVFEEIGWRGFLLPHLQETYTAWKATIYLTIIWAAWHLPFFLYRFEFTLFISLGFFFGLFVGAIILTSIYNSGRGALLPVMLFHLLMNLGSGFEQEVVVAVISTGYVFLAIAIYRRYGQNSLSPEERIRNFYRWV